MYSNKLIYGKNQLERVVSVEPNGENLIIFQENLDGTINQSIIPASYWFITNKRISGKQFELEGNQYYKYLSEFNNEEEFDNVRKLLYQKRIDFYGIYDKKEQNLVRQGITYFKGMKPSEISVLSFDIESDGLKQTKQSEIYLITNTYRSATGEIVNYTFSLENYANQAEMLTDWCRFVRDMDPSIILGHNIYTYDLPYIKHVANLHGVKLELGRDGSEIRFNDRSSQFRKDGSQSYEYYKAYIFGRELVDTLFVSFKYDIGRSFPSYGLKPIIKHLGMEKQGRSFVDASKISKYYHNRKSDPQMWELTKAYAEDDSDDALKLYDLMCPSFFYMTQSISKTYQEINVGATGSQINNMMVRAYLQDDHSVAKADEAVPFEGGISLGIPGIYRNSIKWDLASAYPHTIIQYKLSDKKKDPKAYFLKMVEFFTKERIKNKKLAKETNLLYYKDLEQSQKVIINSFFGFCGANGLNYNAPLIAAEITRKCRGYIMDSIKWATGKDLDYWKNLDLEGEISEDG